MILNDLIRNDVTHSIDSICDYAKKLHREIPLVYDERNHELKVGEAMKPHASVVTTEGKIKRTDKSMDGSRMVRTGEALPCYTDEELLEKGFTREEILSLSNEVTRRYGGRRSNSMGRVETQFANGDQNTNIGSYILEAQQHGERRSLIKGDAGGTEFFWVDPDKDQAGEALHTRLEQYTSTKTPYLNWTEKSKGSYLIGYKNNIKDLVSRNLPDSYVMGKQRSKKTASLLMALRDIIMKENI